MLPSLRYVNELVTLAHGANSHVRLHSPGAFVLVFDEFNVTGRPLPGSPRLDVMGFGVSYRDALEDRTLLSH
jgi:hypothetical protein